MKYYQKVKIKNIDFKIVQSAFHQFHFIKYLTNFQPVRILKWDGINDGDTAHFQFWFFGWRHLIVSHKNYSNSSTELSFTDYSKVSLPLGISFWSHKHIVKKYKNSTYIEDYFEFKHKNKAVAYMLYPVMIAPIIARKFSYKFFFKQK